MQAAMDISILAYVLFAIGLYPYAYATDYNPSFLQVYAPGERYHGAYLNVYNPTRGGTGQDVCRPWNTYAYPIYINMGNPQYKIESTGGGTGFNWYSTRIGLGLTNPDTNVLQYCNLAFRYIEVGDGGFWQPFWTGDVAPILYFTFNWVRAMSAYDDEFLEIEIHRLNYGNGNSWLVCDGDNPNWDHVVSGLDINSNPVNFKALHWGKPGLWSDPVRGSVPCKAVKIKRIPA